jgi:hypothetical protein
MRGGLSKEASEENQWKRGCGKSLQWLECSMVSSIDSTNSPFIEQAICVCVCVCCVWTVGCDGIPSREVGSPWALAGINSLGTGTFSGLLRKGVPSMYFIGVVSAIPPSAVLYVHTFSPARAESPALTRLDFLPSIHINLSLYTGTEGERGKEKGMHTQEVGGCLAIIISRLRHLRLCRVFVRCD